MSSILCQLNLTKLKTWVTLFLKFNAVCLLPTLKICNEYKFKFMLTKVSQRFELSFQET